MRGSSSESGARLDGVIAQAKADRGRLDSAALGPVSLTALGIASVVGAGIFVTTGQAAAEYAGPAVVISFVLAGLAAGATALCYAELASMIPAAGSTYSYAYAVFGLFLGWFIGWDLLLEYLFAASTVAVGWSGYAANGLESIGLGLPDSLVNPPFGDDPGVLNVPAIVIVALTTGLLALGIRQSTKANNAMVAVKVGILLLFIAVGAFYVVGANWDPFLPPAGQHFGEFGVSGVLRGAGVVFFAYVGFDAVSTAAAESRNPQADRADRPARHGDHLDPALRRHRPGDDRHGALHDARRRQPALEGDRHASAASAGSAAWSTSPPSSASPRPCSSPSTGRPGSSCGCPPTGCSPTPSAASPRRPRRRSSRRSSPASSARSSPALMPISALGELVSIGTLLAFLIVCAGVLVLRVRRPDLERPFRVPAVWLIAPAGALSALALMTTLPIETWLRLLVWLLIGVAIFFFYSRPRAIARRDARAA